MPTSFHAGDPVLQLSDATLEAVGRRIPVPDYDRGAVTPGVVHLGVGGFHRAHQAHFHDRLLAGGALDWGICGVGVLAGDRRMRDALGPQDGLYTLVVKHGDGRFEPRVMGAITEYLLAPDDPEAVLARLADPRTRIVSLTITEGGYSVHPVTGRFDPTSEPLITADLEAGAVPQSAFGLITEALRRRRSLGLEPFTVMSCDNIPGNGRLTHAMLTAFAGRKDPELGEWIEAEVRFPDSMVDRITPGTADADRERLRAEFGIEDRWPVVCEPWVQWVIEDAFASGRPPYETVGVDVVADVAPYELMKLRLLNGSHQALCYFGHLCGYELVDEVAQDPLFRRLLSGYMEEEATPTLAPVPEVDLDGYKRTLLERFANPALGDTVARLCAETSDRIPNFLLPVLRHQLETGGEIRRTAAVVASWARYAEGVDEQGREFEVVDRLRDRLMAAARRQREDPDAFVADRDVFGDLIDDARFMDAYRSALASLHERGARATLESFA